MGFQPLVWPWIPYHERLQGGENALHDFSFILTAQMTHKALAAAMSKVLWKEKLMETTQVLGNGE